MGKNRAWNRPEALARRAKMAIVDALDALVRQARGKGHLPPLSLRQRVGGAADFEEVGPWFRAEFERLGFWTPGCRLLDVGCGCGRLAYTFATDRRLRDLGLEYTGMDADRRAVRWCRRHITPLNLRFGFYHADLRNAYYNPEGQLEPATYRFPHPDGSFDLILLTSVFTHLLEDGLRRYLAELRRMLAPGGVAYASFFLFAGGEEAASGAQRHPLDFPSRQGHFALHREDCPERAVAYREDFVRGLVDSAGLRVLDTMYGTQDVLLLRAAAAGPD